MLIGLVLTDFDVSDFFDAFSGGDELGWVSVSSSTANLPLLNNECTDGRKFFDIDEAGRPGYANVFFPSNVNSAFERICESPVWT